MPPIIVDSSIWIDHINQGDVELSEILRRNRAFMHPMAYAEIALGSLKNRKTVLYDLKILPKAVTAPHAEVTAMIEWMELHGTGIGYVDVHLLASARLVKDGLLWTRDKRLHNQATRLGIAYQPVI